MNCKRCGEALSENAKFCAACGEKAGAPDTSSMSTTENLKKSGKKRWVILFILLIGIMAAIAVWLLKQDKSKSYEIDLGKYVSIEYEGYSGAGVASIKFDKRDFFDDYEEVLLFPADFEEKVDELGKSTASMVEFCCDCVDIDMDNLEEGDAAEFVYFFLFEDINLRNNFYLSNGDEVELVWRFKDMYSKEQRDQVCELLGITVNCQNVNLVATGMDEVPQFDPFEGVEISYSGAAPAGKAVLANYPENGWTYLLSGPETVNNGDEIKVSIYSMDFTVEEYIEAYGKMPYPMEKTYVVSGLPEYISSASQIPAEDLAEMQSQAEDIINGTTYNWISGYTLDILYIGNYVLMAKEVSSIPQNRVTLVYKMNYLNSFEDYNTKMMQEFSTEYYFYVTWENIKVNEDGTLVYDKNMYTRPNRQFEVTTPIKEGSWSGSYHDFYLTGYATLDEVYNQCVTQYIEKYKLEENIIK